MLVKRLRAALEKNLCPRIVRRRPNWDVLNMQTSDFKAVFFTLIFTGSTPYRHIRQIYCTTPTFDLLVQILSHSTSYCKFHFCDRIQRFRLRLLWENPVMMTGADKVCSSICVLIVCKCLISGWSVWTQRSSCRIMGTGFINSRARDWVLKISPSSLTCPCQTYSETCLLSLTR